MAMSAVYRKSSIDSDSSPMESRRLSRFNYYFKLESESSLQSDDDTESIHSIQEKETDYVKDTSDTDTTCTRSDIEEENQIIEYEVASPSESDADLFFIESSTDTDQDMMIAAALCGGDGAADTYITDIEDSAEDDSSTSAAGLLDFPLCIQCKNEKSNLQYRYCEKCFQDRKTFLPPRPRRNKKNPNKTKKTIQRRQQLPVRLDHLQTCLSRLPSSTSTITAINATSTVTTATESSETMSLSQDSGLGSSQEFISLDLDQIVVPEKYLKEASSTVAPSTSYGRKLPQPQHEQQTKKDAVLPTVEGRKRNASESSLSSEFDEPPAKKPCRTTEDKNGRSTTTTKIATTTTTKIVNESEDSGSNNKKLLLPLDTRDDDDDSNSINFLDVAGVTKTNKKCGNKSSSSQQPTCSTNPAKKSPDKDQNVADIPTRTEHDRTTTVLPTTSSTSASTSTTTSVSNCSSSGVGTTASCSGTSNVGGALGSSDMQAESRELCTMCNVARKNGIFVHGRDAHMCSCYACAMRIWKTLRRCPICNRKIHNVLRFFAS